MRIRILYTLLILLPIAGASQGIIKQLEELDSAFSRGQYENAKQVASRLYTDKEKITHDTLPAMITWVLAARWV